MLDDEEAWKAAVKELHDAEARRELIFGVTAVIGIVVLVAIVALAANYGGQ